MSYNGSGVFQINSSGQPVVTGTVISSTAFNALTADLATGLSTAITKDGQTTTTSRILFAQGISSTLTTDATSTTTGSIISAGGISCQKQAVVGTNLGVGSAPLSPLANRADVTINGASAGAILTLGNAGTRVAYLNADGTNVSLASETATGYVRFLTNSTERMQITSAGLVGIGCTPTNTLDVSRTTVGTYFTGNGGDNSARALAFTSSTTTNSGDTHTINAKSGTGIIAFAISGTEAARFDSGRNLLVGSTTTGGPTTVSKLVVTNSNTNVAYLDDTDAGTSDSLIIRKASIAGTLARFYYTSTSVGTITTNGTTTTYGTSSDYRLKENVQPMTGGLDIIAALKPVTYDWIADQTTGEGFIAHELQAVIPAAVVGEKDALNKDGNINPQNVDFGKIVPHLVAAIQELTTRLAALENK